MNNEDREILAEIKRRLSADSEKSRHLLALKKQLEDGKATMLTAREYAKELGLIAESVMNSLADRFVEAKDGYDAVFGAMQAVFKPATDFTAAVQQSINEKEGVRIHGITAELDKSKASGIAHNVSNAQTAEDAKKAISGPVRTFTEGTVNDTIEANAGFLQKAGLKSIVTRNGGGKCCAWCQTLEGTYEYGKQPEMFFAQHENCTCTITSRSEKGTRSWSGGKGKKQIQLPVRDDKRLTGEKLADWIDSSTEKDIIVGKSIGAKHKDVMVLLPDGSEARLTEGSRITNIETIGGKGKDRKIDEINILLDKYKGTKGDEWQKKKGKGYIDYKGESYKTELHWYYEKTVGNVEFKVKPDAGGNWFED